MEATHEKVNLNSSYPITSEYVSRLFKIALVTLKIENVFLWQWLLQSGCNCNLKLP